MPSLIVTLASSTDGGVVDSWTRTWGQGNGDTEGVPYATSARPSPAPRRLQSAMIAQREVTIGLTVSLTGRYAHPGGQGLVGVQTWVDDTNRSGGIWIEEMSSSLPVRLVHYDDASNARRCAELTERLLEWHKADILLGPYSSGLALRAADVAESYEHVIWNQGGASDAIYQMGYEWVVGILTPASRYFHGIVDMVRARRPSASTVAIAHSTAGAFPREVAAGAESRCRDLGFDAIRVYPYPAGTREFQPILEQISEDRPDLVLGVGRIEDDLRFAWQLHRRGIGVEHVGLIATPLTRFNETLGAAADEFVGPSQWEPAAPVEPDYGPPSDEVLSRLSARYPHGVDYPMAQAYAGCLVAQRCVHEAGSLDNDELRRAANRMDFTTFYGRFSIDATSGRQIGHAMPVVRWQQGRKTVVWPP